jgi:hypothetical protein
VTAGHAQLSAVSIQLSDKRRQHPFYFTGAFVQLVMLVMF